MNDVETLDMGTPVENNGGKKSLGGKKKVLLIVLAVVLIVLIGLFIGYKFFLTDSKTLYDKAIDKFYAQFESVVHKADNLLIDYDFNKPVVIEGNVAFDTDMTELQAYTGYNYDYRFGIDEPNKQMELYLGMLEHDSLVLDVLARFSSTRMYIESSKLFDGYLYEDGVTNMDFGSLTSIHYDFDAVLTVGTVLRDVLKAQVEAHTFIKQTTTVDGVEGKVLAHSIVLNKQVVTDLKNAFADSFLNNSNVLEALTSLLGESQDDVKIMLEQLKETEVSEDMNEVTIALYTTQFTGNVVGLELFDEDNFFRYVEQDNKSVLTIHSSGQDLLKVETEGDTSYLTLYSEDQVMTMKVTENDNQGTLEFVFPSDNGQISGTGTYSVETTDNTKQVLDLVLNLQLESDTKVIHFSLDTDMTVTVGTELDEINPSNATSIDDLTEEEVTQILMNLMNAISGTPLEDLFYLFMYSSSY